MEKREIILEQNIESSLVTETYNSGRVFGRNFDRLLEELKKILEPHHIKLSFIESELVCLSTDRKEFHFYAHDMKRRRSTIKEISKESPQERREIQEEAFYERVSFVVLGPAKKKGENVIFQLYVPDGVEGAYWIPVKIDDEVEYVEVLIMSFEKDCIEN